MLSTVKKHPKKTITGGVLIVALITFCNNTFATKESYGYLKEAVQENSKEIKKGDEKFKVLGAIMCGMAIDLQLPTATEACKDIISNN